MALLLDEAVDDSSEGEQALVDLARLPRPLVHGARAADVLRAGQVDQIELALRVLLLAHDALLGNGHLEI